MAYNFAKRLKTFVASRSMSKPARSGRGSQKWFGLNPLHDTAGLNNQSNRLYSAAPIRYETSSQLDELWNALDKYASKIDKETT